MALKIPVYDNQVTQSPSDQAPSVPTLNAPPEAAFGTGVARATEQTGQVLGQLGEQLGQHIIDRQRQKQQAQLIDADTKFRQDLQNTMFSTDTVDKADPNDPTNTVPVPAGVFNRQLSQAAGATQDFDTQYGDLRKKYIGQFTNPYQQNEMAKLMDENYTHHRQLVIHHEATQERESRKNIVDGNLKQMVSDAGNLAEPQAFVQQVQMGHDRMYANMKENGADDTSISVGTDKFANDMAKSAITPLIEPTPTKALAYLDSIKSVLTPTNQADLKKYVEVQSRQLDELQKHEKEQGYDANMRQTMLDMFDGKLTLSEAERRFRNDTLKKSDYDILESKLVKPDYQILRDMEVSDPSTFSAVRQAQLDGTKSQGELLRMIASGNAGGKITDDDSKYLEKLTKNVPPDPRDLQISSQAKAVEDFGNRYFTQHLNDLSPVPVPVVGEKQVHKEQTDKAVQEVVADFYKRVDKEGAAGDRINEIAHQVIRDHTKKRYPELNRLSDIPHVVVGIDGKIQRLLQPGDQTKLKGQYKINRTGAADTVEPTDMIPKTTSTPQGGEK